MRVEMTTATEFKSVVTRQKIGEKTEIESRGIRVSTEMRIAKESLGIHERYL